MPTSSIPEQIGGYRILKQLGEGGMGRVYLAEDSKLKRQVAIKVMLDQFAQHAPSQKRCLREARAMAAVKSDHIVTIHRVDEENGCSFFVMEFLKGQSLQNYLDSGKELNVATILRLAEEIAQGLSDAHAEKLIHRDIKPDNLFLEAPKDRVKILDFGLARPMDPVTELTRPGGVMGTYRYMPLEQARGETVDHRADIYSFGIVLYRLCTKSFPFSGDTVASIIFAQMEHTPQAVHIINSQIPTRLSKLIERMILRDPPQKPQTMEEVIREIQSIRGTLSSSQVQVLSSIPDTLPIDSQFRDTKAKSDERTRIPKREKKSVNWGLYLGLGAFILALVALVIVIGRNPDPQSKENKQIVQNPEGNKKNGEPDQGKENPGENKDEKKQPELKNQEPLKKEENKEPNKDVEVVKKDSKTNKVIPEVQPQKPSLLKASFSESKAKEAQEAWKNYLRRKVIEEINLGNGVTMEMVLIPPGTYQMGTTEDEITRLIKAFPEVNKEYFDDEKPQRTITIIPQRVEFV